MRFSILFRVPPEEVEGIVDRCDFWSAEYGFNYLDWDYEPAGLRLWYKRKYRPELLRFIKMKFLMGTLPEYDVAGYQMRRDHEGYHVATWWRERTYRLAKGMKPPPVPAMNDASLLPVQ